ncbi:hypothetical protein HPP92_011014 [Vanilla planifolia]|uniref:Meiosis-specific protein ASY3-like coiled-coil domain-containing protein n=1 Tax=Vanilla planifolia TaxID=51239 RepID=A0A835R033_VANPL|nr:hypothetical protein HPP92_011014 [Vanilla planifolia]
MMVETGSQKVGQSDVRSLGSSQRPSGRSAKVSIGITIDKSPTVVSGIRKEDTPALHHGKRCSTQEGMAKQNIQPERLEKEMVDFVKQKDSEEFLSRFRYHEASNTDSGKFNLKHVPVLNCLDLTNKMVNDLAYVPKPENDANTCRGPGFAFNTIRETNFVSKETKREKPKEVDRSTINGLKMRLWEILGGVPSQDEPSIRSVELNKNKDDAAVDHNKGSWKGRAGRPKQSSDPIETDSDSANQTTRRPTTRSMTHSRAQVRIEKKAHGALNNGKKPLSSSCLGYRCKVEKKLRGGSENKNIFSFHAEGNCITPKQNTSGRINIEKDINKRSRCTSDSKCNFEMNINRDSEENIFSFDEEGNKIIPDISASEKNKAAMELRRIPNRSSSKSSMQKNEGQRSFPSPAKVLGHNNGRVNSPSLPSPSKTPSMPSKNASNDSHHSKSNALNAGKLFSSPLVPTVTENAQGLRLDKDSISPENLNESSLSKSAVQLQQDAHSQMTWKTHILEDQHSPTFAVNEASVRSRKSNEFTGSPLPIRNLNLTLKFLSSEIVDDGKPRACCPEANTESFYDTRELHESQNLESNFMGAKVPMQSLSLSPTTGHDSDGFRVKKERKKEFGQPIKWFPTEENSPYKPHKRRMTHGFQDTKSSEGNPSSPSAINISPGDESFDLHESSVQLTEDNLARVVNQLALSLKRFKSKIILHTNKKSCEIVASVANTIKLQLEDVESKIHEETGQLRLASKSKRKRLESQFDGHHEKLKLLHEKFKEEVNQQILNCSSTLEELEAQNTELKGTADRHKATHGKLLIQVEEAMKDQLTAAEASIAAVRKDARKKLNSLKLALRSWLGE